MMKQPNSKLQAYSLLPLLGFLLLYMGSGLYFTWLGQDMAFYQFPAPACALFGFAVALIIGCKNIDYHIKTFANGIGDETVVLMCIIFLLAGAFSALTQTVGSAEATVNLGIYLLPDNLLLPGLFLISCFVSFSLGSSMGTISTITPIAIGISQAAGLSLPLVAGTVVGGAMFGDNLSIISDTTIAATGTQSCSMRDKMKANIYIALPAAFIVLILLFFLGKPNITQQAQEFSLVKITPYLSVLLLALLGINVVVVLMVGIVITIIIGLLSHSLEFAQIGTVINQGFESMSFVFFVTILIAGLAAIALKEGGLEFILTKLSPWAQSKKSAELLISSCAAITDICVANNTVAIIFVGPLAKKIGSKFSINKARVASLIDIFSCVWQGLIPHGAQILLVSGLCQISGFSIISYAFYPIILGILGLTSIIFKKQH